MLLSYVAFEVVIVGEGLVAFKAFVGSETFVSGLDVSKKIVVFVLVKLLLFVVTERHRETERDRETERQRDRETERQRDRETERQRDRRTNVHNIHNIGKTKVTSSTLISH